MKFALFVLCVIAYVAMTVAQERCPGLPHNQNCQGGKDEGHGGRHCHRNKNDNMWYFNHRNRECVKMRYQGCGGNRNRYCSKRQCEQNCRRH